MVEKKIIKGCLIGFIVIVGAILGLILYIFQGQHNKHKQAEKDSKEQSLLCDTVQVITEQPEICFSGFEEEEISQLTFQILRNGISISEVMAQNTFTYTSEDRKYKSMKIPYDRFLKTDTIIVITKSRLYFYLSGYHHYAYLEHGMFGYLGTHHCRFSEACTVNGVNYSSRGTLVKTHGWLDLQNRPVRIFKDTPEFKAFENKSAIKYDKAVELFTDYTQYASPSFRFCEGGGYIFSLADRSTIKVDAQTGTCTQYDHYPILDNPNPK